MFTEEGNTTANRNKLVKIVFAVELGSGKHYYDEFPQGFARPAKRTQQSKEYYFAQLDKFQLVPEKRPLISDCNKALAAGGVQPAQLRLPSCCCPPTAIGLTNTLNSAYDSSGTVESKCKLGSKGCKDGRQHMTSQRLVTAKLNLYFSLGE